jgi:hypothetical protein
LQVAVENAADLVSEDGIEIYLLKVNAKNEKVAMELLNLMKESDDFLQIANSAPVKKHHSAEGVQHSQDEVQDDQDDQDDEDNEDDVNTRMRKLP